jgi:5-oxoprolinase (ATP-hydrolysing)
VYDLKNLYAGHKIVGPAIILAGTSTILVENECIAEITEMGDVKITVGSKSPTKIG